MLRGRTGSLEGARGLVLALVRVRRFLREIGGGARGDSMPRCGREAVGGGGDGSDYFIFGAAELYAQVSWLLGVQRGRYRNAAADLED